jgi:Tol biopolymer transport system component
MRIICVIAAVVLLTMATVPPASAQSAQQLFQQALSKERAEGKLEEAIELYRRVVEQAGFDRALASRALLQLGRCYEKLGQSGAREAYERLLRDYADQEAIAGEAKTRLAAMSPGAAPARPVTTVRKLPVMGIGGDLQAISPDGTKALVGDYTQGQNLAVFDFATEQSRLFTTFDWGDYWVYWGIWSPDGRRVAFMQSGWKADSAAELRVSALTGEPRTVYQHPVRGGLQPIAWAPDGTFVLVVLTHADRTSDMGLVSIANGRFTSLKTFGSMAWPSPALSPDGRRVAFVERTAGPGDVHVLSIDGQEAFRVTDDPSDDRGPVWSPDGRHLAFISNRFGADALWAVEIDGGRPRGDAFKVRDGMLGARLIDWSSRGITVSQFVQSFDLYTVPTDAAAARTTGAPRAVPYARTGSNVSPAWSPDGKSLAFISGSASDPRRRYLVVLPRGGKPREFMIPATNLGGGAAAADLRWFGNGRGLGFSGSNDKGENTLFRLSLETGAWNTAPIPVKGWTRSEWNEDGSVFYYARQSFSEPNGGIFERSFDGERERRIYLPGDDAVSMRGLEFSPDRQWMAFHAAAQTTSAVVVVNMSSGETRTLVTVTSGPNVFESPILELAGWSPDGRVLVQRVPNVSRAHEGEWLLYPVEGGTPQKAAFDIPLTRGGAGVPPTMARGKWSPDGSSVVYSLRTMIIDDFVIEHPLADVRTSGTNESAAARR